MRIKIILKNLRNKAFKRDHYYQLSSVVYNMLREANPKYSKWLHQKGYEDGYKHFKFFNISKLIVRKEDYQLTGTNNELILLKEDTAYFYISSPIEEFLTNLVSYLLAKDTFKLGDHTVYIDRAVALPNPAISENTTFKSITPIVITKKHPEYRTPFFIRAYQDPEEFDKYITKNALEKYKILTGKDSNLSLNVDREYLKKKVYRTVVKIQLKENQTLFGSLVPVEAKGEPAILNFLYDVGLGEKNSQGMGMVEIAGYRF